MSDRRRRRLEDEGEEEEETVVAPATIKTRPSECESEGESVDVELSEQESALSESAGPEVETEDGTETETEDDSEEESDSGTETEGGEGYTDEEELDEERRSGDGEEQPEKDKPDDDEDKKNPAYVPRKGAFYEHDMREGEEGTNEEETNELKPKKKLWQDEGKWAHDRYTDASQAPKSREELIAIYGYDIRAADKPPEALLRKPGRGRGPRRSKFQDFIPRMAVIDTTENGSDSVPVLDDDLILYDGPSPRYGRNNEGRRGGRGGQRGSGRYRGGTEAEHSNNRNWTEDRGRYNNRQQDVRRSEEYPSLEESSRQMPYRGQVRDAKKVEKYENLRNDYVSRSTHEKDNSEYNSRREFESMTGRYHQSQDARVDDQGRDSPRHQHNYRNDRRGGYGSSYASRESGRSDGDSWRSTPSEYKDSRYQGSHRNDSYNRYNRGGYRDNSQRKHQEDVDVPSNSHSSRLASSGDAGGYSKRGNHRGYESSPRYQQHQEQHHASTSSSGAGTREALEYTNTSFKSDDERTQAKSRSEEGPPGDGGDGNATGNSKNMVISNKENVQTINVTITSTTTEKKSYAKERRAKGASKSGTETALFSGLAEGSGTGAGGPYPGLTQTSGMAADTNVAPPGTSGIKRYSSQRQQGLAKGTFNEPPPVDVGAKLYNPALPPPSFFHDHSPVTTGQRVTPSSAGVQNFPPTMLAPAAAPTLPYGLPVPSAGLALPPNAGAVPSNPALFQAPQGPPPASPIPPAGGALLTRPYITTGMIYGPAPRVPPPGTPAGYHVPLAYTSPPPQPPPAVTAPPVAPVATQQSAQGTSAHQQGAQTSSQHKKVYRGDITYYAPELQQPSRTQLKRPKAAIPIVDPQEIRRQKQREKAELRNTPERMSASPTKQATPSLSAGGSKGVIAAVSSAGTIDLSRTGSPQSMGPAAVVKSLDVSFQQLHLHDQPLPAEVQLQPYSQADIGCKMDRVTEVTSSSEYTLDTAHTAPNGATHDSERHTLAESASLDSTPATQSKALSPPVPALLQQAEVVPQDSKDRGVATEVGTVNTVKDSLETIVKTEQYVETLES